MSMNSKTGDTWRCQPCATFFPRTASFALFRLLPTTLSFFFVPVLADRFCFSSSLLRAGLVASTPTFVAETSCVGLSAEGAEADALDAFFFFESPSAVEGDSTAARDDSGSSAGGGTFE
ncbi:hypothetical protein PLICRDRAFT_547465 [Plicaturopsis crispa FD-325 SS-3]|nr:hypothetical protein PLICRDRAFT_547465 [Plicaturopsis crispa FD-325 SS-3]